MVLLILVGIYVDSDVWIEFNTYEEFAKIFVECHPDIIAFDFVKEYPDFSVE